MDLLDRQEIEFQLLLTALKLRHGYDFTQYAPASLKRRVRALVDTLQLRSISELTERLIHDENCIGPVIAKLSVPVSELFREPASFAVLRQEVLPELASHPHLNIWQAGCAHGEEVYSLAVLLTECGLYERAHIYATDISDAALARAQEGIYPDRDLTQIVENYQRSGGSATLETYFTHRYGHLKVNEELKRNITFANHNLVSDGVFGEMHLILCRNVLIYFADELQNRALQLFRDSLGRGGFLCIGTKESLHRAKAGREFQALHKDAAVYRLSRNA